MSNDRTYGKRRPWKEAGREGRSAVDVAPRKWNSGDKEEEPAKIATWLEKEMKEFCRLKGRVAFGNKVFFVRFLRRQSWRSAGAGCWAADSTSFPPTGSTE